MQKENEFNPNKEVVIDLEFLQGEYPDLTDEKLKEVVEQVNTNIYIYDRFMETVYEIVNDVLDWNENEEENEGKEEWNI